jgi:hypothetical protein
MGLILVHCFQLLQREGYYVLCDIMSPYASDLLKITTQELMFIEIKQRYNKTL